MKKFGLIGFPLSHSFSKKYYLEKFEKENIEDTIYDLFPIASVDDLPRLIDSEPLLAGINITIPHKISVMKYVDHLSDEASSIAAVNCIRIERNQSGKPILTGFNTDVYGFEASLRPLLKAHHRKALVLGSGGASKAVTYALSRLEIPYIIVSRSPKEGQWNYDDISEQILQEYALIINTTPLGTFPDIDTCPDIPYEHLNGSHLLYDLVYNPDVTTFLKKGREQGATVKNGFEMLVLQAEKNWEIWNT